MPIMTRIKGKATKIAYKVLGTPPNMRKNKADRNMDKRLAQELTSRVR